MLKRLLRWAGIAAACALILLAVLLLKPVPETTPAISPRESTQYWRMQGGYRIAYTHVPRRGDGPARPPIIFLHGGPGGYVHSSTIAVIGQLAEQGRDVYLYDQSGTGLSDRRPRPKDTTIEGHLTDLDDIRRQIGADKVVLIGHSFGGLLAALYAADQPERVDKLVLSAPGVLQPERFDPDGAPATARMYPTPADLTFKPPADYVEATGISRMPLRAVASFTLAQLFDVKLASDREMDAAIDTVAQGFTRTMVCDPAHVKPEEGGAGGYSRVGTNFYPDDFKDRRPAMRQMAAPVLVLQGQCDFLSYSEVYEYVSLFPNATYRFMPGAGHIIWWDKPEDYRLAIQSFLSDG
jgi:proline iminopeptidase